jgi:DNA-binding IclR family transcriptional regulator
VARVREGAHLSVREGPELLTLMSERPSWAIQAAPWVGHLAPLHCTSAGRALLFDHTDDEVRALLASADLAAGGPNAPRDLDDVLARLREARERGYAVVDEEFEPGCVAVAAPVRDFRGHVVAALNVTAPKFRLGRAFPALGREVRAAADCLTRFLTGAPGPDDALPTPPRPDHRRIS